MPDAGGDAERLVILLESRITDLEKNMAKASGVTAKAYREMSLGSKKATTQMETDIVRSTSRINNALAVSGTRIGQFGKSFALGAVAPIAGLLTLTAAINGTKAALDKFSKVNDQSIAAGLDPEFFQGIAYQAKLSGVEIDTTADALATFAKNAGLAAEGKGRMVTALQALNPELLKNIVLASTQEQRVRLVADAIKNAKDQAEAAAIASAAFGDSGKKLVQAFSGGADAIDATIAKAREVGIIVDRDVIAHADELGDKWDTISEIIDNKVKVALVNLGPVIVSLASLVADLLTDLSIVADQFQAIGQRNFINPLQTDLAGVENTIYALKESIAKEEAANAKGGIEAFLFGGSVDDAKTRLDALYDHALELQERIDQLSGKPTDGSSAPAAPSSSGLDPDEAARRLAMLDQISGKTDELTKQQQAYNQMLAGVGDLLGSNDPFVKLQSDLDTLGALLNSKQIDWDQYAQAVQRANAVSIESTLSAVGQITGTLAGAFQDNKALAIANAVINTAEGVTKAWAQGGVLGFVGAAAVAAAGAAQIAAIASAQPGSAKSASASGGSPSGGSAQPAAAAAPAPAQVTVQLIGGGRYSRDEVLGLIKDINSALGDGATIDLQ